MNTCMMCLENMTYDDLCDTCLETISKNGKDMDGDIVNVKRNGESVQLFVNVLNSQIIEIEKERVYYDEIINSTV